MEVSLDEARENLANVLGDASSEYFKALKAWFRGKLSKEQFDECARALMPDSGGARALDVHNDFFLAILDRCQIRLSNHRGAPVFMGTGGSTVASTGGRGTVSNFEFVDENQQQSSCGMGEVMPLIESRCELVYERGHLPDRGMLAGRVHLAAWEHGMRSVDADDVADVVYDAIDIVLKNVLQGAIELRRSYLVNGNGFKYLFGAKKRVVHVNDLLGPQTKTLPMQPRTRISVADVLDAFLINPNLLPSHSLRTRFIERLTNCDCDHENGLTHGQTNKVTMAGFANRDPPSVAAQSTEVVARFKFTFGTQRPDYVNRLCQLLSQHLSLLRDEFCIKNESYCFDDANGLPRTEIEVTAKCRQWDYELCLLLCQFSHAILPDQRDLQPVMIIQSSDAFLSDCLPFHTCGLNAIHFGNFCDAGTFLNHFKKVAPIEDELLKVFNKMQQLNSCNKLGMLADFEHDGDQLIVRFAIKTHDKMGTEFNRGRSNDSRLSNDDPDAGSTNNQSPYAVVSITVRYSSIRRILVDVHENNAPRIYLYLNYPPRINQLFQRSPNAGPKGFPSRHKMWWGEGHRTFERQAKTVNDCPVFALEFADAFDEENGEFFYKLLSRLHNRTKIQIEATTVTDIPVPPYVREPRQDDYCRTLLDRANSFPLEYLIEALLSRGAVVKDQLLLKEQQRNKFIELVCEKFQYDKKLTLDTLERLLNELDEKQSVPLVIVFNRLFNEVTHQKNLSDSLEKEGYVRVRKVVVTPTRNLYVVPELLMGNRVLRSFDKTGESSIRVQFRDDDCNHMRKTTVGSKLIRKTIDDTLRMGLTIAGRQFVYLGSSNSQMRDNGCYFFDKTNEEDAIAKIRADMGQFNYTNIPKMMSRMGQCFTQAKEFNESFQEVGPLDLRVVTEPDIQGGRNSLGTAYTFSDGVGRVSFEVGKKIARDLHLPAVPSAFQIRYLGYKGVLTLDPTIDERNRWLKQVYPEGAPCVDVVFRDSQKKFESTATQARLEIVKVSAPTPVCLNRPWIAILDQVSDGQSYASHQRICERIHALLERQLFNMAQMLINESKAREKLESQPRRIDFNSLSRQAVFNLTTEPFFRSLLMAIARFEIKKQMTKEQIAVPLSLGRSMFGVMDETGQLQYGQVFIQITVNGNDKNPNPRAKKRILGGDKTKLKADDSGKTVAPRKWGKTFVQITKNPCINPGDVRIFEAVDIPELRHLVDVVVFPQHGPRPHPDEMAGSDLDGDEYSVIWDPELLFDYNEPASEFLAVNSQPEEITTEEIDAKMREFFVKYVTQDSIGMISNAHLVNADLYGINSQVCQNIAKKQSMAVDFPKTGYPAADLERKWTPADDPNEEDLPPEKAERWPDFMMKNHEPSYVSPRLVGQLYRRVKQIEEVLTLIERSLHAEKVVPDVSIDYPGWEMYKESSKESMINWNAYIRGIMENYGIEDEGQLMSGSISKMRNRISDRDMDDMSYFNTDQTIKERVNGVWNLFREHDFFEEFGGYHACTSGVDGDDDTRRICLTPTDAMKQKAVAWYKAAYDVSPEDSQSSSKRLLSFPWVVWDILMVVKKEKYQGINLDPVAEQLSKQIDDHCRNQWMALETFRNDIRCKTENATFAILKYTRAYTEKADVFEERFQKWHLCLLLIQFGVGYLTWRNSSDQQSFLNIIKSEQLVPEGEADESLHIVGLGKILINFLQYLCSRSFETTKMLDFNKGAELGYECFCMRGEWMRLHRAAITAYYRLVFTGKFEAINSSSSATAEQATMWRNVELEPFMIELPTSANLVELRKIMQQYSGVKHLHLRKTDREKRVKVSAVGTLEALHKLRDLLAVKPNLKQGITCKEMSNALADLVYEKILSIRR